MLRKFSTRFKKRREESSGVNGTKNINGTNGTNGTTHGVINGANGESREKPALNERHSSFAPFKSRKETSNHSTDHNASRGDVENTFEQFAQLIHASRRPLPTQSGDGSYLDHAPPSGLMSDIKAMGFKDVHTLIDVMKNKATGELQDDKTYLMEHTIQNILYPQLGAANTPYARSVSPNILSPGALPDPALIFDSVMARKEFKPHPNKVSSVFFYWASLIIHDLFQTDHRDFNNSQTSSYLDLSTLYGDTQEDQDQIRTFKDGKLKADCFSEQRILGFPPGCVEYYWDYVVDQASFHNYVVEQLAVINENGRFNKPNEGLTHEMAEKSWAKYDNDLFQTGRLITCGLYINITLLDYLRTIVNLNRSNTTWTLDPRAEMGKIFGMDGTPNGVGNQVSAEFNLAYRWHSCISDKDDKWTQELYKKLFGKEAKDVSMQELLQGLGKWEHGLPKDPQMRPFADLKRDAEGKLPDDELVEILTSAIEDTADPPVAEQLKNLYEHPDHVEMYPGMVSESAKVPMVPGVGIAPTFTISRAILSDAVALVRGDRFYTIDYNPKNLTNWGYCEVQYDLAVQQGCENRKILRSLGREDQYSWERPAPIPPRVEFTSYQGAKYILEHAQEFNVMWNNGFEWLMGKGGVDFMLSGDTPFHTKQRKLMGASLYRDKWHQQIKEFYEYITLKLLTEKSCKIAGINQVDITRDDYSNANVPSVGNLAHVHFAANVFSLPLKTEEHPHGVYSEQEMYMVLAVIFTCIFFDLDPAKSFPLRLAAKAVTQQLGKLVETNVKMVNATGWIAGIVDGIHQQHSPLTDYGVHMIRRLLESGMGVSEITWSQIVPTAGAMVANQAQVFTQLLDYYLSDEGKKHLPEINRWAKIEGAEADDKLLHYAMEGIRLNGTFGSYRQSTVSTIVDDGGRPVNVKPGDKVFCSFVSANREAEFFPEPDRVRIDRPMDTYIHYGLGPHACLGGEASRVALTAMLRVVGRLENLRRAPGPQGQLKKIPRPGGFYVYMRADHGSYFPFPTTMKINWDGDLPPLKKM
ncbi:MAG: hypothetical protein Q9175_004283 [Cornicularia normoerica]